MLERIYHLRTRTNPGDAPDARGGATVVVRSTNATGYVHVTESICHPKDAFNKRIGRDFCQENFEKFQGKVFEIPLRSLPAYLGSIHKRIYKNAKVPPVYVDYNSRVFDFLPKV